MLANIMKYGFLVIGVSLLVGSIYLLANFEAPKDARAADFDTFPTDLNTSAGYAFYLTTGTTYAADPTSGTFSVSYNASQVSTALGGGTAALTNAALESDAANTVFVITTVGHDITSTADETGKVSGSETVDMSGTDTYADCDSSADSNYANAEAVDSALDAWVQTGACEAGDTFTGNQRVSGEDMIAVKSKLAGPDLDPSFTFTAATNE